MAQIHKIETPLSHDVIPATRWRIRPSMSLPMLSNNQTTYFARGYVGYQEENIGIKQPDRRYHFYTIGRTGTGKSTLLFAKIVQDLRAGRGIALIDPHGDLAEAVLPYIPKQRQKQLVYLNPADLEFPIGLNMLEKSTAAGRLLEKSPTGLRPRCPNGPWRDWR